MSPARQPRGSNECGVHVIVHALRQHFGMPRLDLEVLDLQALRRPIAEASKLPGEKALTTMRNIASNVLRLTCNGTSLAPHAPHLSWVAAHIPSPLRLMHRSFSVVWRQPWTPRARQVTGGSHNERPTPERP